MSGVLDASAIVCWLKGEPGVDRMREIRRDPDGNVIHGVNIAEIGYIIYREDRTVLAAVMAHLRAAHVSVAWNTDEALLTWVVDLKTRYAPISLADAFAVALAADRRLPLITTDRGELQKVAQAGVCQIEFLR